MTKHSSVAGAALPHILSRAPAPPEDPLQLVLEVPFGKNVTDIRPVIRRMTFGHLVQQFTVPDTRRGTLTSAEYHALDKKDPQQNKVRNREKQGSYFCVAHFKDGGSRNAASVLSAWGIALDFDSGRTTGEQIREALAGMTYLAYTSYSHRPAAGQARYRVIIPFSEAASAPDFKLVYRHFLDIFDGDLDAKCGSPEQPWYPPACPTDAASDFECFHEAGELLNPSAVVSLMRRKEKVKVSPPTPATMPQVPTSAPTAAVLSRLASALRHVDADDRSVWITVGLAIKREYGDAGREAWDRWSATSAKYDPADAAKTWESMAPTNDPAGAVTIGTVFHWAKQGGWADVPESIKEINAEYFVAPQGGRVRIFREEVDPHSGYPRLTAMPSEDFKLLLANRYVVLPTHNGQTRKAPVAVEWINHPLRRQYAGVILNPASRDPSYYNRWRGFAVEPRSGSWRRMRWHILFVICSGNRRWYQYLLNWMTYCVQHPERAAEVAVVLRGGRGTGKGMFLRTFGQLFGAHFQHITHSRHLTGNFNAHLADALVVFADEAFFAGDKQSEGSLKALITEPTIPIEAKFCAMETVPNRLKVVIASNNEWVVPAGTDERRFFVLDVSDRMQQNLQYFAALKHEIEQGGREALLDGLLKRDLKRFQIRTVPDTSAMESQKVLSLLSFERWWLDKLNAGEWRDMPQIGGSAHPWHRVPKSVVQCDYQTSMKNLGMTRRSSDTELGMALKKVLPEGWPKACRVSSGAHGSREPHYEFPPLDECRAHFEKVTGIRQTGLGKPDGGGIGTSASFTAGVGRPALRSVQGAAAARPA